MKRTRRDLPKRSGQSRSPCSLLGLPRLGLPRLGFIASLGVIATLACGDPNARNARPGSEMRPDGTMVDGDGNPIPDPNQPNGPDSFDPPSPDSPADDVTDDDVFTDDDDSDVPGPDNGPVDDDVTEPSPVGDDTADDDIADDDIADPSDDDTYFGARVRRLSNVEYVNTIESLFDIAIDSNRLAQDTRQHDFTRNVFQAVDPVLGGQLQAIAREVASEVVTNRLNTIAPCAATAADSACATSTIDDLGSRVYRRPLDSEEVGQLVALFDAGAEGQPNAFAAGMEVVLQAMLQSASFLYVREIGQLGTPGELTALDSWEAAAALSYLLTAYPPDDALREAAAAQTLADPSTRETHAVRLLETPAADLQMQRFVKEWLKLDRVPSLDKADPRFGTLREAMAEETSRFVSDIAFQGDGRLATLLTAGYTFVSPELASFYGVQPDATGRVDLTGTGRVGLLQQASFLSANSQTDESGPILRGVAVLRKLTCMELELPDPSTLTEPIMPPPPDPSLTTRERFAQHAENPCASCHRLIDPIGFSFENFGPIGELRTMDANKPVDTSGELLANTEVDGPINDSTELSAKLAASDEVKTCFARQLFRYGAAQGTKAVEDTFLRDLQERVGTTDDIRRILAAYAGSDSFLLRRTPTAAEQ